MSEDLMMDEEGWNMDAVEDFRKREEELASQDEYSNMDQPVADDTANDPYAVLNDTMPTDEATAPINAPAPEGLGPFASAKEYAPVINPEKGAAIEAAKETMTPGMAKGMVFAESALPLPIADEAYSAFKAAFDPELDYKDWSNIVYGAEESLPLSENLKWTAAGTVAGLALPSTLVTRLGSNAQKFVQWYNTLSPKKRAAIYGLTTGARGVTGVTGSVLSSDADPKDQVVAAINTGAPYILQGALAGTGKMAGALWKRLSTSDFDTRQAISKLEADPLRYDDLASAQEERAAAVNMLGDVVEHINTAYAAKEITKKQKEEALSKITKEWENIDEFFRYASKKAGNLTDDETGEVTRAYIGLKNKVKNLERDANNFLPDEQKYLSDPAQYGFSLSEIAKEYNKIVNYLGKSTGTKPGMIPKFEAHMRSIYDAVGDDAVSRGATPEAVSFIKRNKHLLLDPKAKSVFAKGKNVSANRIFQEEGTNVKDVMKALSLMENVSPTRLSEVKNSIFERGSGYAAKLDKTEEDVLSERLFKQWHGDIRKKMGLRYPEFEEAAKVADDLKQKVLFPIEDRLQIRSTNLEDARKGFERGATELHSQMSQVISRWSAETGVDLVQSAKRLKLLNDESVKYQVGKMNMSRVMDHIAEGERIGKDTLEAISMMPPEVRIKFRSLEEAATRAIDTDRQIDILSSQIMKEGEKFKGIVGKDRDSVRRLVEEITTKRIKPSSKQLLDVSREADELSRIENFGREYLSQGVDLGKNAKDINGIVDRLKRVRESELLTRSINLFGPGSSSVNIGQSLGKAFNQGRFAEALGAISFGLVNQLGSGGARLVVKNLMRRYLNRRADAVYSGIVESNIARLATSDRSLDMMLRPGEAELESLIQEVRNDRTMKPLDKVKAIKDLRENGLDISIPDMEG